MFRSRSISLSVVDIPVNKNVLTASLHKYSVLLFFIVCLLCTSVDIHAKLKEYFKQNRMVNEKR